MTDLLPPERLLWDEADDPSASVLVIDAPRLAAHAAAQGRRVSAFADSALEQSDAVAVAVPGQLAAVDEVWIALPKSLDALDEYCTWAVSTGARRVLVGARIKDLTRSATTVLERHFRTVTASLGRDKARVLRASDPIPHPDGWRLTWPRTRQVSLPDGARLQVTHHGGTFASGRLDPATELLLAHLDPAVAPGRILDWGSGAGIIAACVAARFPGSQVEAVDSSWAAANSTLATAAAAGVQVEVHWVDGVGWLSSQPVGSIDLIVSNPPFHQGVAKDSGPTRAMLEAAVPALRPRGELWLVHNSHLPWPQLLRSTHRGPVARIAQDRQFTVTRFTKDERGADPSS